MEIPAPPEPQRPPASVAPDRYLLQLWPFPPQPDMVVRQHSEQAAYGTAKRSHAWGVRRIVEHERPLRPRGARQSDRPEADRRGSLTLPADPGGPQHEREVPA